MLRLLKFGQGLQGNIASRMLNTATVEPEKTQRRFLLNVLKKNACSYFGKVHGFEKIHSESDYRGQVPIRDYEDFRPFVSRILSGERSVLTKEEPLMFTMTSGTTSKPKYIPVTREFQANNSSLMRQWLYRAELDHPGLTSLASVGVVSRAVDGITPSGLPYGSASGSIYKNIPWFIRRAYAVPYLVSEIEDYDARYFVLARFALALPVSFIATPNPSTLLRLAKVCVDNEEELIRAIHDGKLGVDVAAQPGIQIQLSSMLKPNPARAKALGRIVSKKGSLHPADCWPDLRLLGCWLGGSVGTQASKLAAFYGNTPLRDLGFMASEGSLSLPIEDGTSSGILAIRHNYYEFIAEAENDSGQPTLLSSHQLENGKRYSILLTTTAGLYRYRLNDIIQVTGFYHRAPVIKFVRKAGEMTSIMGEKMHVNHLLEAIDFVRQKFDLKIEHFRAAPNMDFARYEIYLELNEDFPSTDLLINIDEALQRSNLEYRQKRKSLRLESPCLHMMRRGWSKECVRRHIAAGRRDTQYKPKILYPAPHAEDAPFISRTVELGSYVGRTQQTPIDLRR